MLFLTARWAFRLATTAFWWKTSRLKVWHWLNKSLIKATVAERQKTINTRIRNTGTINNVKVLVKT